VLPHRGRAAWWKVMNRHGYPILEVITSIAASPAAVFRVIADPRSKLLWVPAIRRVEMETDVPLGLGVRYLASSGVGPVQFVFHEQISEWVENRRVAYGGRSRWGAFHSVATLAPEGAGTRMSYRMVYAFPGGWLGAWLGRLLARLFADGLAERVAARFKHVVEQGLWDDGRQLIPPGREKVRIVDRLQQWLAFALVADGVITVAWGRGFLRWQRRIAPGWYRSVLDAYLEWPESCLRLGAAAEALAGGLWLVHQLQEGVAFETNEHEYNNGKDIDHE
jgi:uncharacterized protein YndB with AHSA1/START domain